MSPKRDWAKCMTFECREDPKCHAVPRQRRRCDRERTRNRHRRCAYLARSADATEAARGPSPSRRRQARAGLLGIPGSESGPPTLILDPPPKAIEAGREAPSSVVHLMPVSGIKCSMKRRGTTPGRAIGSADLLPNAMAVDPGSVSFRASFERARAGNVKILAWLRCPNDFQKMPPGNSMSTAPASTAMSVARSRRRYSHGSIASSSRTFIGSPVVSGKPIDR